MNLVEIEKAASKTDQPVVQRIYKADQSQLIAIGMKSGVTLPDHKAPSKAKIMVIKGEIDFNTETHSIRLAVPDSLEIPFDVTHWIEAYEDALFLLHIEKAKLS